MFIPGDHYALDGREQYAPVLRILAVKELSTPSQSINYDLLLSNIHYVLMLCSYYSVSLWQVVERRHGRAADKRKCYPLEEC